MTPDYAPMEMRSVEAIPDGPDWQYEPKWDGFRALAHRDGAQVELTSKNGQPLSRYFPEIVAALAALPGERFSLDGELVLPLAGALSFDALQQRIHPAASRVTMLARTTPALYLVFDLLREHGEETVASLLRERRARAGALRARLPARAVRRASVRRRATEPLSTVGSRRSAVRSTASWRNAPTVPTLAASAMRRSRSRRCGPLIA